MKSRQGFVSNSSTSSFIIVATKKDHEQAIAGLDKETAKVISKAVSFKKLGTEELVFLSWTEHNEGISTHNWDNVDKKGKLGYVDYCELTDPGATYGDEEVHETWTGYFSNYREALENPVMSGDHY